MFQKILQKIQLKYINKNLNKYNMTYMDKVLKKSKSKQPYVQQVSEKQIEQMKKIAEEINNAANKLSLVSPCLCRSLLCHKRLSRKHYDVDLKIGIKGYPFEAHAWIEYHGIVINDTDEHIQEYVVFDSPISELNFSLLTDGKRRR